MVDLVYVQVFVGKIHRCWNKKCEYYEGKIVNGKETWNSV